MASITAVELNYIIYRYLQESGFLHTAFNFGYEAGINNSPINGNSVPPAALVRLVQLGLEFKEMEANADNDIDGDEDDFYVLQPMDLITKEVDELQQIVKDMKKNQQNVGAGVNKDSGKESPGWVKLDGLRKQRTRRLRKMYG